VTLEDDLLALERRVLGEVGGDFFRAVADLRRMLAGEHPGTLDRLIRLAVPQLEAAAQAGTLDAWRVGADRALGDATLAPHIDANAVGDAQLRLGLGPPSSLTNPLAGLDAILADAKTRSIALLASGADTETAAAPIFQASNIAAARVVTQIHSAANTAATTVGEATGSPMVWEAERDACVYCLALAGEVVETPGTPFPPADLYAPVPASGWTVEHPPLHPYCRCQLAILVDQSYADGLKREAQRSILRGFSLQSESQAVRLRAAERLLARDPVAPKSVKDYARKAIKAGRFPTRDVPEGAPRLRIN
jgi:hypothetical protein